MKSLDINQFERKSVFSLASIFSLRMLGLFMILPIFSLYAVHFKYANPFLIGLALGAYGLTSAIFQAPLGMLSDRFGRKKIIILGLIVFALGSVVAGFSHNIYGVIVGRSLQGAGAVGSTVLALLADLTREEVRTRAMATIGISIGASFMLSLALGPIFIAHISLSGIFFLTAILAVVAIIVLIWFVPSPKESVFHRDQEMDSSKLKAIFMRTDLLSLNFAVFVLHAVLMATFVALPVALLHVTKVVVHQQWLVYLPVLIIAFILMVPMVVIAEKKRKMRQMSFVSVFFLCLAELGFYFFNAHISAVVISLLLFFTAFTYLEATLPSWISKVAPVESKGTAIGIYSTSQFFGAFVGGALGGWLYGFKHFDAVFMLCFVLLALWLVVILMMKSPPYVATRMLNVGQQSEDKASMLEKTLASIKGVVQARVVAGDGIAYLKVDSKIVDDSKLFAYSIAQDGE